MNLNLYNDHNYTRFTTFEMVVKTPYNNTIHVSYNPCKTYTAKNYIALLLKSRRVEKYFEGS